VAVLGERPAHERLRARQVTAAVGEHVPQIVEGGSVLRVELDGLLEQLLGATLVAHPLVERARAEIERRILRMDLQGLSQEIETHLALARGAEQLRGRRDLARRVPLRAELR